MALSGMDVQAVSDSANQLNSMSGQLQALIGQLDSKVNGLTSIWMGADSSAFVGAWPDYKTNLDKCKSGLDDLVTTLRKEIQQQTDASTT